MKMDIVERATGAKYECLLFDLDDTLYPLSIGFNLACRKNIEEFMLKYLDIEESEVPRMCLELYREYGTTMAGLKALGYEFDNDEFHAYAHGRLPYETLRPDPVLRNLLLSMPQRKIIFTNGDKAHAQQVLKGLCLEECFEGIICFETLNPPLQQPDFMDAADKSPILCKPSLEAFEAAIQLANVDPKKTIFFDDSARNIATGKAAGLHTVIVGSSTPLPEADYVLRNIHNIKEAIPELWDGEEGQMDQVIQQAAVETTVLA
ncbi:Peptidyl-prolyl cis-trans isomerase [Hibiscus syriacus]|uniref:Peptidyl-prolyl cis-trans isomerase n=1 Tax=Hibiscus syriacus TaxID=106335 RepID=A0A6A2WLA0_HIBSY|nr:uncharacterized protein C24B11.05-like [Hibiscus syriacus]KAE8660553.1 Peptidyl-prolyl cis-trans isomerase [Hibiscus syriacus]